MTELITTPITTGLVRRYDPSGRLTIPRAIRTQVNIDLDDNVEFLVGSIGTEQVIIIRKFDGQFFGYAR